MTLLWSIYSWTGPKRRSIAHEIASLTTMELVRSLNSDRISRLPERA